MQYQYLNPKELIQPLLLTLTSSNPFKLRTAWKLIEIDHNINQEILKYIILNVSPEWLQMTWINSSSYAALHLSNLSC